MAEVLLFHHVHGLTEGVRSFADELRAAGHVVHTPELYEDGRTFDDRDEAMRYADGLGMTTFVERGRAIADELPTGLVYAGFSLGAVPAQALAQTRPGAKGALLFYGAIPLSYFGGAWPDGVPVQAHVMEDDELGDVEETREFAETVPTAELFVYPGDGHLFADETQPDYDGAAAAALKERVLAFLERVD
jgi:dienelactone hydrolase